MERPQLCMLCIRMPLPALTGRPNLTQYLSNGRHWRSQNVSNKQLEYGVMVRLLPCVYCLIWHVAMVQALFCISVFAKPFEHSWQYCSQKLIEEVMPRLLPHMPCQPHSADAS